jgi:hypothetical protein
MATYKGPHAEAQGAALGRKPEQAQALKERDTNSTGLCRPFRALGISIESFTQGCALGFHITPFQGLCAGGIYFKR